LMSSRHWWMKCGDSCGICHKICLFLDKWSVFGDKRACCNDLVTDNQV
jgi:hypothetical protein